MEPPPPLDSSSNELARPESLEELTASDLPKPRTSSQPSSISGKKRRRVVLSILQKQQVLERLDCGEKPSSIADIYGISRQQVSDIKKNECRIQRYCTSAQTLSTMQRKTLKSSSCPNIERDLLHWFSLETGAGRVVTNERLNEKLVECFALSAPTPPAEGLSGSVVTNTEQEIQNGNSLAEEDRATRGGLNAFEATGDSASTTTHTTYPTPSQHPSVLESESESALWTNDPKATAAWLRTFKRRHGIKRYSQGDGYDGLMLPDEGRVHPHLAHLVSGSSGPGPYAAGDAMSSAATTAATIQASQDPVIRALNRRISSLQKMMHDNLLDFEERMDEMAAVLTHTQALVHKQHEGSVRQSDA